MSNTPIRILVADDHPMVRTGLAAMIRSQSDFLWVGEAGTGAEAVAMAAPLQVDLVLMDLVMPLMDGVEATALLLRQRPQAKVIILTSVVDASATQRAIKAGANGFISKTASAQELVTVIRNVHAGRRMMSPDVTDALIRAEQTPAPCPELTQRERDVLDAMSRGLSNLAVAQALSITVPTVKFHVTNILGKLQVENRTEAVLFALRNGLVDLG